MAHAEHHPGVPADGHANAHDAHAAHAHGHGHGGGASGGSHATGQQHPLGVYFKIWGLLFVLSIASYMVDYFHLQGFLRWSLIIIFMFLKAGLIVAVFMHMVWERLALVYAIVVPPLLLGTLLAIGALEANYTVGTRDTFFGPNKEPVAPVVHKK